MRDGYRGIVDADGNKVLYPYPAKPLDEGDAWFEDFPIEADRLLMEAAPIMYEALDQIADLSYALRSGGPAPEDLWELSGALEEAVDIAVEAMEKAAGTSRAKAF